MNNLFQRDRDLLLYKSKQQGWTNTHGNSNYLGRVQNLMQYMWKVALHKKPLEALPQCIMLLEEFEYHRNYKSMSGQDQFKIEVTIFV